MSVLDQIYNAPAQASHTLLGGALILILGIVGVIIGISSRNKRP